MLIPFDQLFARHHIKAKGALHIGANFGQEADAYAANGIERVIWIEALPAAYDQLVKRIGGRDGSVCLLACVSDVDGQSISFKVANNDGQSSSMLDLGTHQWEHPTVKVVDRIPMQTVRVDTLLTSHNIVIGDDWFLNVDVQGAELLALKGMGDLLRNFKYAYVEVNSRELYKGCPLVHEIDEYLAPFGLLPKETLMTKHAWGDRMYVRI